MPQGYYARLYGEDEAIMSEIRDLVKGIIYRDGRTRFDDDRLEEMRQLTEGMLELEGMPATVLQGMTADQFTDLPEPYAGGLLALVQRLDLNELIFEMMFACNKLTSEDALLDPMGFRPRYSLAFPQS